MSLRRRTWLVCFLSAVVLVVGTADRRLPLLVSSAAAADTVSLDPFEIDLGVARLRVPHLEASGTTLDKAGLTALLDPKSSLGLLERLDKLTAASITASDVTLESTDPLGAVRLSYKQITFSDVVRGRIGKLAATGGALGFDAAALKAAIDGGLGDVRIDNLDLGLLARSVTQPRQDAGEPVRALFDHAEFDGFHIKAGDSFAVSTGKWSLADVQLRPLLASTLAGPEVLLQSYLHTDEERSLALGAGFITDLWSSLIVGDAEIRDIAVRFEWDGGRTTYTLSRVHLGGIGRGKFEDMALEGMGFDSPGGRFKLALYAIRGLDLSGILGPLLEAGKLSERKRHETDSAAAAEDAKAMLAAVADFYDGLSLRATEVQGLDFVAGSGPKSTAASLGRYALVDLAHSHVGDLAVERLHVATPEGHFAIGEFSLHDFDYGPVLKGLKLMAAKAAVLILA